MQYSNNKPGKAHNSAQRTQITEKVKGLHFSIYKTKQTLLQLEKRVLAACIKEHGHLAFKCKGHLDSYGGPSHSLTNYGMVMRFLKRSYFFCFWDSRE